MVMADSIVGSNALQVHDQESQNQKLLLIDTTDGANNRAPY